MADPTGRIQIELRRVSGGLAAEIRSSRPVTASRVFVGLHELGPLVDGCLDLEVRDVDTRDEWREAFGWRVPCVEYEDRVVCEYRLDRDAISAILAAQS